MRGTSPLTTLFFFGSLRDHRLLETVLGRPVAADAMIAAAAPGYTAWELADEACPCLAPDAQGRAAGSIVRNIGPADLDRLDYYGEGEFGLAPITVTAGGQNLEAQYFCSTGKARPTDRPWDFSAWCRDERAVAREAAAELMAHIAIVPVEESDRIRPGILIRARMRVRAGAEVPVTGTLRPARAPGDVVSEAVERPYTAFFALEEHRLRHRRFDGTMSEPIQRTVLTSGDAVTIVPYDPATDSVMLIEQFRAPMYARGDACPWGIEAIAGRIDRELDAEACARREAIEEGGVGIGAIETVARYYSTPGIAAEHITSLVGHARLDGEGGLYGLAHEHEDIRAFTVGLDAALAAVATGEINNAPAILTLLWLDRNRARLAREWSR